MDLLEYRAEHVKDGIAVNYFIQRAWKFREFMSSRKSFGTTLETQLF